MNKTALIVSMIGLAFSCKQDNTSTSTAAHPDSMKVLKQERMIQGPSGLIYVRESGSGKSGIPVVFAHSFSGNTSNWQQQLEHLRKSRRAIAFDFRSHGKSSSPADTNYSAEALAGDIAAVADSLGLDQFVLVGHSMGGAAVIAYTGMYPERVAGIILAGTPGKSVAEQSKSVIASLESNAYQQVMDQYLQQLLQDSKPETVANITEAYKKITKETSLPIIKALFQFDPLPILEQYEGPKLIIATVREDQQPNALHHQMPRIPKKIIEGTGHWIQMDKPETFNTVVDEFLKTVERNKTEMASK